MMQNLRLYWDILRLRRGPEDLPASVVWLVLTIVGRVGLGLVLAHTASEPAQHAQALVVIDTVTLLVWGQLLLRLAGKPERFLQTISAMFGCDLLLQAMLVPLVLLQGAQPEEGILAALLSLAGLVVLVWGVVAVVRILRAATGWPTVLCIVAVFAQELMTFLVAAALYPDLVLIATQAAATGS